jgi:hypothetical protein
MSNGAPGSNDFTTLCGQIADYANRQDWPQGLVAFFVQQAEQKFNSDLRVDRMIATAQNTVTCNCSTLPDDWLESDLMLIQNPNQPTGWGPIHYMPRDEFFRRPATPSSNIGWFLNNTTYGYYTIEGRTIWFGGPPNATEGVLYQLNYYQEVPVMATVGSSWVYTKYPKLYLFASLANADFHAVGEEQLALLMGQQADAMIAKLNDNHRLARASGSRLSRTRRRSFG